MQNLTPAAPREPYPNYLGLRRAAGAPPGAATSTIEVAQCWIRQGPCRREQGLIEPQGSHLADPISVAVGTSATIPMVTDRYTEVFAEAGVSALLYDHRNLGISGGEPRREINSWVQSRGFRDAVNFAATLE